MVTTLQFLGATGCVTGWRFVLKAGKDRMLIDCGLFQGTKELSLRNWARFPIDPSSVDHVILTHPTAAAKFAGRKNPTAIRMEERFAGLFGEG